MATIKAYFRTTKKNIDKVNLRFYVSVERGLMLHCKSDIELNPEFWEEKKECIKAKVLINPQEKVFIDTSVREYKNTISQALNNLIAEGEDITSENLNLYIDKIQNPEKYIVVSDNHKQKSFFELMDYYISTIKTVENNIRHLKVIKRALMRFENYKRLVLNGKYRLDINLITSDTLREIENFLGNEPDIYSQYPEIYEEQEETRVPVPRGQNTISGIMRKIAFF